MNTIEYSEYISNILDQLSKAMYTKQYTEIINSLNNKLLEEIIKTYRIEFLRTFPFSQYTDLTKLSYAKLKIIAPHLYNDSDFIVRCNLQLWKHLLKDMYILLEDSYSIIFRQPIAFRIEFYKKIKTIGRRAIFPIVYTKKGETFTIESLEDFTKKFVRTIKMLRRRKHITTDYEKEYIYKTIKAICPEKGDMYFLSIFLEFNIYDDSFESKLKNTIEDNLNDATLDNLLLISQFTYIDPYKLVNPVVNKFSYSPDICKKIFRNIICHLMTNNAHNINDIILESIMKNYMELGDAISILYDTNYTYTKGNISRMLTYIQTNQYIHENLINNILQSNLIEIDSIVINPRSISIMEAINSNHIEKTIHMLKNSNPENLRNLINLIFRYSNLNVKIYIINNIDNLGIADIIDIKNTILSVNINGAIENISNTIFDRAIKIIENTNDSNEKYESFIYLANMMNSYNKNRSTMLINTLLKLETRHQYRFIRDYITESSLLDSYQIMLYLTKTKSIMCSKLLKNGLYQNDRVLLNIVKNL